MMDIKRLYNKYRHFILYAVFGVLTTVVNIAAYYVCAHIFHLNTVVSTAAAWIIAVLFAYVTNRKWVFATKAFTGKEIAFEMFKFFACRFATGVLDVLIMYVSVDVLHLNDLLFKFLANVIVIVLNYICSRLIIFAGKKQ